ncbi:hypothetical protein FRB91_006390, partial [Serendipita sp. 411]
MAKAEPPQWIVELGLENPSINEFLHRPDLRPISAFFLGILFSASVYYIIHSPTLASLLSHFISQRPPPHLQVPLQIFQAAQRTRDQDGTYAEHPAHTRISLASASSIYGRMDPLALVFILDLVYITTTATQFGSLLAFDTIKGQVPCTFLVAWASLGAQTVRLVALLKLSLQLRDDGKTDQRQRSSVDWERVALWIALSALSVVTFLTTAVNTGVLRPISQVNLRLALCYMRHFTLGAAVTSGMNLFLETYILVRLLVSHYLRRRRLRAHSSDTSAAGGTATPITRMYRDIRLYRTLSLILLDAANVYPSIFYSRNSSTASGSFHILLDTVPFSVASLVVLWVFNRPYAISPKSGVEDSREVNTEARTARYSYGPYINGGGLQYQGGTESVLRGTIGHGGRESTLPHSIRIPTPNFSPFLNMDSSNSSGRARRESLPPSRDGNRSVRSVARSSGRRSIRSVGRSILGAVDIPGIHSSRRRQRQTEDNVGIPPDTGNKGSEDSLDQRVEEKEIIPSHPFALASPPLKGPFTPIPSIPEPPGYIQSTTPPPATQPRQSASFLRLGSNRPLSSFINIRERPRTLFSEDTRPHSRDWPSSTSITNRTASPFRPVSIAHDGSESTSVRDAVVLVASKSEIPAVDRGRIIPINKPKDTVPASELTLTQIESVDREVASSRHQDSESLRVVDLQQGSQQPISQGLPVRSTSSRLQRRRDPGNTPFREAMSTSKDGLPSQTLSKSPPEIDDSENGDKGTKVAGGFTKGSVYNLLPGFKARRLPKTPTTSTLPSIPGKVSPPPLPLPPAISPSPQHSLHPMTKERGHGLLRPRQILPRQVEIADQMQLRPSMQSGHRTRGSVGTIQLGEAQMGLSSPTRSARIATQPVRLESGTHSLPMDVSNTHVTDHPEDNEDPAVNRQSTPLVIASPFGSDIILPSVGANETSERQQEGSGGDASTRNPSDLLAKEGEEEIGDIRLRRISHSTGFSSATSNHNSSRPRTGESLPSRVASEGVLPTEGGVPSERGGSPSSPLRKRLPTTLRLSALGTGPENRSDRAGTQGSTPNTSPILSRRSASGTHSHPRLWLTSGEIPLERQHGEDSTVAMTPSEEGITRDDQGMQYGSIRIRVGAESSSIPAPAPTN